ATALNGKNLFETAAIKEAFILIGNESKGVHEELISLATNKITIPKIGEAESLNAAVAAGIVMAWLKK
ncbi:MAG TPA: TrmH family RNA methyltransferase, partial [Puia sp.]|nr:TrmH family RNA methyltransferase [Puia sp.]